MNVNVQKLTVFKMFIEKLANLDEYLMIFDKYGSEILKQPWE